MGTANGSHCGCKPKSLDARIRDRFIRTNVDLLLLGIGLALYHAGCVYAETSHETTTTAEASVHGESAAEGHDGQTEEEILTQEEYNVYAVLYPW